jgi:hypothetical protein
MTYYDGPDSDAKRRREDAQLRARLLHHEALDLMRPTNDGARGLVPMPWRLSAKGRRPVAHGFIVGSRANAAALAMDLDPSTVATAERTFGTVVFVSPKPIAEKRGERQASPEREAVRRRADGTSPVVLSDHEMMKALGIKPVGYLD